MNFGYGNSYRYNTKLCYLVVPKCASSVLIRELNMNEIPNTEYKIKFTFIRHPFTRLKSFMWQQSVNSIKDTEELLNKIIKNFYNCDEHCYPYSDYVNFNELDFIGTLENFNRDITKITNKKIARNISINHQKTLTNKTQNLYVNTIKIYNELIIKNKKALSKLYENDFKLFQKVKNAY